MDSTATLTPAEVIDRVHAARATAHHSAVEELQLAVEWALLHPCPADELPADWGEASLFSETITPLAGVGAPLVAEFAPAELAAALGISLDAGRQLVADALELTYRLPRLWDRVLEGAVPVWRARAISRETHDLGVDAVAFADRLIAATPGKVSQVDATRLVEEARVFYDPDRAIADEEHELTRRGVWLKHRGNPTTTDVVMTLETPHALAFNETVTVLAAELHTLGDTEDLDHRRATAVGILADPQYALDLLTRPEGGTPTTGAGTGAMNLFLHLTTADLEESVGAASIEKLGAATTQLLHDWLTRHTAAGGKVLIRPVLDLADDRAVDQHDPPERMREHVIQRDALCVFPGCRRDSRTCDIDHITEYVPIDDGGPPGQTHPDNLAPLCRTHHRIKTFTTWVYKRTDEGTYTWTAPTGHQYDVHPSPRRPPRRPPAAHREEPDTPRPRPAPAGATAMPCSPIRWFRQAQPAVVAVCVLVPECGFDKLNHRWSRSAPCSRSVDSTSSTTGGHGPRTAQGVWTRQAQPVVVTVVGSQLVLSWGRGQTSEPNQHLARLERRGAVLRAVPAGRAGVRRGRVRRGRDRDPGVARAGGGLGHAVDVQAPTLNKRRETQVMVIPPSTGRVWPVM